MMKRNLRLPALAVAAALAFSCLLTGCADSSSVDVSGSSGGSDSTPTQSTSTEETVTSDFTYNTDGTFTGKDGSTIKVAELTEEDEKAGVAQVLERTYETPTEETIEQEGTVVTAETIKQDASGNVLSVTSTYAVSGAAIQQLANNPVETALVNEALDELNELILAAAEDNEAGEEEKEQQDQEKQEEQEDQEGQKDPEDQEDEEDQKPSEGEDKGEGSEEETVKFYKFMVEYRYEDSKLVYATLYCQPYTEEAITPETAPLKVSYTVDSTTSISTWSIDWDNTTQDLQGLSWFETGTTITAFVESKEVKEKVKQQGENAIVQAQGTIEQVEKAKQGEKAKWKITTSTTESMTTYLLTEQTEPYRSLRKVVYSNENIEYQKTIHKTTADGTVTDQTYGGHWYRNSPCDLEGLFYTNSTYTKGQYNETVQVLWILPTWMEDHSTGKITIENLHIEIGSYQEVKEAYNRYIAVSDEYPYPKYDSNLYENYAQYRAACDEVDQKRYEAYKEIPNSVVILFKDNVYDEALGTDEAIAAVRTALIEQYSGDEEISSEMSLAELLKAWSESIKSIIWETRDQVESLLS
jgi:hypothetical protein